MLIRNPPVEIVDGLWMLGTSEYPLYLLTGGDDGIVFEGGTGAMGPLLAEQIEQLAVAPESVKQIVVTHAHPDHVMAVPMFRRMFPGAQVLASGAAARTLASEKAVAFFCQVDEALTGSLLKAGRITEAHRPQPLDDKQIAVDRPLKEGDVIEGARAHFDVLETPGHSECSLSFREPKRGILIASDATGYYLPDSGFWWPNYFSAYAAYVDSMRRLASLGAEVLCLSHNAVIRGAEDVASYFSGAILATEEYHQRIVDEARAGRGVREIAGQLGSEVYEKTQLLPVEFFQKNCALLVKLSLKHEGIETDK